MLYVNICVCVIIFAIWSYILVKTYQLDGYFVQVFLNHVFEFKLAFGDKNKLVFTKRMIRFWIFYRLNFGDELF